MELQFLITQGCVSLLFPIQPAKCSAASAGAQFQVVSDGIWQLGVPSCWWPAMSVGEGAEGWLCLCRNGSRAPDSAGTCFVRAGNQSNASSAGCEVMLQSKLVESKMHSDYWERSAALLPWLITVKQHLPWQRLFCFSCHVSQSSSMPAVIPRWSLYVCGDVSSLGN